jgi:hypothetical protein
MVIPAVELLGTDTAHRTTGRSRRGTSLHEAQTKISRNLLPVRLPHLAARINKIQGPSLLADRIGAGKLPPLRRSERESHRTRSPLTPAAAESEPRNTEATAAGGAHHELQLEKKKIGIFSSVCSAGSGGRLGQWDGGESGWGAWSWDQNRTLPPEIARRRPSGDLPSSLSLAVSDGLMLWSLFCLVFGKHSVSWSISFLFGCFYFFPPALCPLFSIFMQKITFVGEKKR